MKPKPVRLRLSRSKGFNLQRHSLETNGFPAMNVARPAELKGKNLACWCSLDEWCHADVLLRVANP